MWKVFLESIGTRTNWLSSIGRDVEQLAAELKSLMDGKYSWRVMREDAYRLQITSFSDRGMAKGVAHVYDAILGE